MYEKLSKVKNVSYNYYVNEESATHTILPERDFEDAKFVYEKLAAFCKEHQCEKTYKKLLRYRNAVFAISFVANPDYYSPKTFREKSLAWNVWTYSFAPHLFIISFASFLHLDFVSLAYGHLKKIIFPSKITERG